jgi:hypothetical protein
MKRLFSSVQNSNEAVIFICPTQMKRLFSSVQNSNKAVIFICPTQMKRLFSSAQNSNEAVIFVLPNFKGGYFHLPKTQRDNYFRSLEIQTRQLIFTRP